MCTETNNNSNANSSIKFTNLIIRFALDINNYSIVINNEGNIKYSINSCLINTIYCKSDNISIPFTIPIFSIYNIKYYIRDILKYNDVNVHNELCELVCMLNLLIDADKVKIEYVK